MAFDTFNDSWHIHKFKIGATSNERRIVFFYFRDYAAVLTIYFQTKYQKVLLYMCLSLVFITYFFIENTPFAFCIECRSKTAS